MVELNHKLDLELYDIRDEIISAAQKGTLMNVNLDFTISQ